MAIQGKEQVIKVDYKTILNKVMSVLGVSYPPVFSEIDCGAEGVKVSVNIDLSFCNQGNMEVIEGKPFIWKKHSRN